jgi:pyruvate formate lyase activating enzyme
MSQGIVYNIQRMSTKDGPGIRTTVFLKGCPLRCLWCSNPESQQTSPQLLFFSSLCTGCGLCFSVCPHHAVGMQAGISTHNAALCQHCGACAAQCPSHAREMSGKSMSVDEVMAAVKKDALFYENSGGGVTFGGGEPTAGGQFFLDLVAASLDEGFHVAVDTCGQSSAKIFDKALELADLFLFDCKHMDAEQHTKLTGHDNSLILRNMQAALSSGKEVRIRMPLIPYMNDDEKNIAAMATFFHTFDRHEIEVMPYHAFGLSKYAALGKAQPDICSYSPEALHTVLALFTKHGLSPIIV